MSENVMATDGMEPIKNALVGAVGAMEATLYLLSSIVRYLGRLIRI